MSELGKKLIEEIDKLAEDIRLKYNLDWYPMAFRKVKELAEEIDESVDTLESILSHTTEKQWLELWTKYEAAEADCHMGRVEEAKCPVCASERMMFSYNGEGARKSITCEECRWKLEK